jgi:hypothetical protein
MSAASYAVSRREPISRIAARTDSSLDGKPRLLPFSRDPSADCFEGGDCPLPHPAFNERREENRMSLGTILLIILILVLIGAIPTWPYSRGWGYFPSGIVGVVVVVLLVMVLMGRL